MLILLHTILRCKVTTFFAYLQIFSKFYVNQKLAGSQKRNKKDQKQFLKKHKKHCRYATWNLGLNGLTVYRIPTH